MANSRCEGHLRIECRSGDDGKTFLAKQSFHYPMHLSKAHWDGNHLIINVVNSTAGLFAGDNVQMDVRVCRGGRAVLTSPSATRVFRAKDSVAATRVTQTYFVEGGGRLEVLPEMFIPHSGARYGQATKIEIQEGGELFFTEIIAPGRTASGESFEYRELEFGIDLILAGRLAVRECFRLTPDSEGVRAIRKDFPNAYFASSYFVANRPA
ncbi:MAG TPA: urease accessory protein UreD, partial [Terrimicrobiaceae bacterium]